MFDFFCSFVGCNGALLEERVGFLAGVLFVAAVVVGLCLTRPKIVFGGLALISSLVLAVLTLYATLAHFFEGFAHPNLGLANFVYGFIYANWIMCLGLLLTTVLVLALYDLIAYKPRPVHNRPQIQIGCTLPDEGQYQVGEDQLKRNVGATDEEIGRASCRERV